jgi:hypothetical protein
MSSYTPGPWGIRSTGAVGSDGGKDTGYMICLTHPCTEDGDDTAESLANARLIAAAPSMLALLEHVPHVHEVVHPADTTGCPGCEARAILSEVEGGK